MLCGGSAGVINGNAKFKFFYFTLSQFNKIPSGAGSSRSIFRLKTPELVSSSSYSASLPHPDQVRLREAGRLLVWLRRVALGKGMH